MKKRVKEQDKEHKMDYLYITLNKNTSQYAISLDDIFLTLYGFAKKKNISSRKKFKMKSYESAMALAGRETQGIVYRVAVSDEQHDTVRDILCDFLMDSRYRTNKIDMNFTSAEFVTYILDNAGIISFEDSKNGIAEEDLSHLTDFDTVDIFYEGDLKKYVAEKRHRPRTTDSNIRHLYAIKKNEEVMEHSTAQYEYVPNQMQKLVTAD